MRNQYYEKIALANRGRNSNHQEVFDLVEPSVHQMSCGNKKMPSSSVAEEPKKQQPVKLWL